MVGHEQQGALAGLRIIDLSRVLGGPYATQILADHGAEVIRVERVGGDRRALQPRDGGRNQREQQQDEQRRARAPEPAPPRGDDRLLTHGRGPSRSLNLAPSPAPSAMLARRRARSKPAAVAGFRLGL